MDAAAVAAEVEHYCNTAAATVLRQTAEEAHKLSDLALDLAHAAVALRGRWDKETELTRKVVKESDFWLLVGILERVAKELPCPTTT